MKHIKYDLKLEKYNIKNVCFVAEELKLVNTLIWS